MSSAVVDCEKLAVSDGVGLIFTFPRTLRREDVETMAHAVEMAMEEAQNLRLLLDFSRTTEFDLAAFASAKGAITSVKSIGPVQRYAVVGAPDLAAQAVKTFGSALPLEARTFAADYGRRAREWLLSSD